MLEISYNWLRFFYRLASNFKQKSFSYHFNDEFFFCSNTFKLNFNAFPVAEAHKQKKFFTYRGKFLLLKFGQ